MGFIEVFDTHSDNKYVKENAFQKKVPEELELPIFEDIKKDLPHPYWENHESSLACYWKAWELAFGNLRKPVPGSGFITNFIDTAFNGDLFMWDSAFILLFARYGTRAFDFLKTFDNFYAMQHRDGFICRQIRESDGADMFYRYEPAATGPNIMPLAEWEYYLNFGDKERLKEVFPVLVAYHQWFREYRTWRDGSYFASGWGCGMDNQPRMDPSYSVHFSHGHMVWTDTCFQQILSAKLLLKMSDELGRRGEMKDFEEEIEKLTRLMNDKLWDSESAFYYDLLRDDTLNRVKSIGAFWSLLAGVLPEDNKQIFIAHLTNEKEFNRPHPIPSLSADHPDYHPEGEYWRGGVWAPTNYMVLKGLTQYNEDNLAHSIALKHLDVVVKVFESTGTLWENYAPESAARGNISKPEFVGWTGLVPIAVLLEYVFGLRPDVPNNRLVWDVRLLDAHGISNYPFGKDGMLELDCQKRNASTEKPVIRVRSNISFSLLIRWEGGEELAEVSKTF